MTPAMVDAYINSRLKGLRRCKSRACNTGNSIDRTACHKCDGPLSKSIRSITPNTIAKNIRHLHGAFQHAKKWYCLPSNPFSDAELPRAPIVAKPTLTLDQQRKALDACPDVTWRAFVYLGLTTGVRRGDLAALKWDNVDLDGGSMKITEGKTGAARKVLLSAPAVGLLRDVRLTHAFPEVFVARGPEGHRIDFYEKVRSMMDLICQRAGIPRFTFHATRRTLATDLAAAGVNQVVATAVIGHASIATTAKFYTGVNEETKRAALNQLPIERTGT